MYRYTGLPLYSWAQYGCSFRSAFFLLAPALTTWRRTLSQAGCREVSVCVCVVDLFARLQDIWSRGPSIYVFGL